VSLFEHGLGQIEKEIKLIILPFLLRACFFIYGMDVM
jgi:hypothetical protein